MFQLATVYSLQLRLLISIFFTTSLVALPAAGIEPTQEAVVLYGQGQGFTNLIILPKA